MNRTSLIVLLATSMAATVGCASKNYVRQETTPLINKTNELDDLTAKNTNAIKDVDARAQAGIQEVTAKAAEVDQKAQAAATRRERPRPRPTTLFIASIRCRTPWPIWTTTAWSPRPPCISVSTKTT